MLENLQKSDAFILPSEHETFGMVYLEALASGCITVCSKNDGVDGIIRHGKNGFLTSPNKESIKKTLEEIRNSTTLDSIQKEGYKTIKDLSEEKTASNYITNIKA